MVYFNMLTFVAVIKFLAIFAKTCKNNLLKFVQGREYWLGKRCICANVCDARQIYERASVQAIVEYCSPGAHCYAL